jgi:glycopeptide antibiotics resistance protein
MFLETLNKTILSIWPQLTIFIVVLVSVRIAAIHNGGKKTTFHEEFLNLLFVIYVLLLFELLTGTENATGSGFNLVPFSEILRYKVGSELFIYNVIGNVLLFIPFGYFVSRYANSKKVSQIFLVSMLTSATIELMQLKIGRTFDIDDIILNVLGGVIGYYFYVSLNAIRTHLPSFFQKDFIYNIICFIILGVILVYVLKLMGVWWL